MNKVDYWFTNRFTTRNHDTGKLITVTIHSIRKCGGVYEADVIHNKVIRRLPVRLRDLRLKADSKIVTADAVVDGSEYGLSEYGLMA